MMSKFEIKIYHGAVVCKESKCKGDITIGSLSIIHPATTIIAEAGPIVLGDGNIVEEKVIITNKFPKSVDMYNESQVLTIGNNNVFEVGCVIECSRIGDNNVFESKCYVGLGIELGSNCIVGAGCRLIIPEVIPDSTLIFGNACSRKTLLGKPLAQNLQREFLFKILPNYHHLKKAKKPFEEKMQQ